MTDSVSSATVQALHALRARVAGSSAEEQKRAAKLFQDLAALGERHGHPVPICVGQSNEATERRRLGALVRAVDALGKQEGSRTGEDPEVDDFYWNMVVAITLDADVRLRLKRLGRSLDVFENLARLMTGEDEGQEKILSTGAWRVGAIMAWARDGFHVVRLSELQAAAFAWSEEHLKLEDARSPWRGWAIDVPDGVLPWTGLDVRRVGTEKGEGGPLPFATSIRRILVEDTFDPKEGRIVTCYATTTSDLTLMGPPLIGHTLCLNPASVSGSEEDQRDARLWESIRRIAFSTMISLSDPARLRGVAKPKAGKGKKWRAPSLQGCDYVEIDQPILVDARPVLWRYLATGESGKVGVRVLVRGHHKRQRCGARGTERKTIWVNAYWRGEDEAPVLVHRHELAPEAAASGSELLRPAAS